MHAAQLHRRVAWCWVQGERCSVVSRFDSALSAAHDASAAQDHPAACLYVLATPIGNLADIGLRALHVLTLADVLACEDTRHSQTLLRGYGIDKPSSAFLALHQHNETSAAAQVIVRLQSGQRVVYLSDAGTPAINDPGAKLVALVQTAGFRVIPIPGASSVTAMLSVSGCEGDGSFVFLGFLPSKSTERQKAVQRLSNEPRTQVFLEAPHRIQALAKDLQALGERELSVGRELSKQFEEVARMPAQAFMEWLETHPHRAKGEFAMVLHPLALENTGLAEAERVLDLLLTELPVKTAVKLAADISGAPRNALYAWALQKKPTPGND
ncbi:MAG: 16S rRNA (cytidine(1402)-2'-O)-methyltransferase [Betaproteobacteria bacterium]|nr:16S rRNA (cytidine(1402)-2'-O)-methyltransferase [Betaproteobacteria bacterium]